MRVFQTALIILVTIAVSYALPGITSLVNAGNATSILGHTLHTANYTAQVDTGLTFYSQQCIDFISDNPDWHYGMTGVWGNETGTFGPSLTICVPTNDTAGGAMFIGSVAAPTANNTKLECFFPTSSANDSNCDVSLVDGYSLSVTCHANGTKAGGAIDLWKTRRRCMDRSQKHLGICKNDNSYLDHESDVTPFFQEGIRNGNEYCIWKNCSQNPHFPIGTRIECHVSGSVVG